jgi:8-amino-7-oxononanoate synthase
LASEPAAPVSATGATASRLIVGNHGAYAELEAELAELKGTEAALVFSSGYAANTGTIAALVGRDDAVDSDRLNHASIVDGVLLSRARQHRYRHGDLGHLAELLARDGSRRRLIVTDSVFSMDGDTAELAGLAELAERHEAMLMVDEAHAGGVWGPQGAGLVAAAGLSGRVDVQMGTLSKAYGVVGGYVAGSRKLIEFLNNHARTHIYSTGLPPGVVSQACRAVRRARREDWRRDRVIHLADRTRDVLHASNLNTGRSRTQIIPVIAGDPARALRWSRELEAAGIAAVAIRPPTVPTGSARLRLSLSAAHRDDDLDRALARLTDICRNS